MTINEKYENLKKYLLSLENVIIAFSGGVDSTFLLKTAHEVLKNNVLAITIKSDFIPEREIKSAINFCEKEKIKHSILELNILDNQDIKKNPTNRCYFCKKEVFTKILEIANQHNIIHILEGSNLDDNNDYRPGKKAVLELNIKSPLEKFGFTKDEIRILSKKLNLEIFDKPSFSCLASRFAYGEEINKENLKMIELAENFLLNLNFKQLRVRVHKNIARIEVMPQEFEKLINNRIEIVNYFKKLGFLYITMDLIGYRLGSMNETIIY